MTVIERSSIHPFHACSGAIVVLILVQVTSFMVRGDDDEKWTTLQPEFRGAPKPPEFVRRLWGIYNLIPFPLVKIPEQILEIEYLDRIEVGTGRYLFARDLRSPPTRVAWPKQYVRSYYALIMTGYTPSGFQQEEFSGSCGSTDGDSSPSLQSSEDEIQQILPVFRMDHPPAEVLESVSVHPPAEVCESAPSCSTQIPPPLAECVPLQIAPVPKEDDPAYIPTQIIESGDESGEVSSDDVNGPMESSNEIIGPSSESSDPPSNPKRARLL
nr:PREDICTED: uncharacterized protein LOC109030669 [Bemisia tabaci]